MGAVPVRDPFLRYPMRNDTVEEEQRLAIHQQVYDPRTIQLLGTIGIQPGWACAELGAGRGSIAAWLADRVGPDGSVMAVDRDVNQLGWVRDRPGINVVQADLNTFDFPEESFDLVHARAVLMHLDDPASLLPGLVSSLKPGGCMVLQEGDGLPSEGEVDAPESYQRVMTAIAKRYTAARHFAEDLRALGLEEVTHEVTPNEVIGGTMRATYWMQTVDVVTRARAITDEQWLADVEDIRRHLMNPRFKAPLLNLHTIVGRRPAGDAPTSTRSDNLIW
ncbi:MAG TPA: class I SAM-dependent methyltransferase [Acidimicrobiales bacterium]|nr:class I SAM-dependent methyltransferase [Acidimicrobiales bacterium]